MPPLDLDILVELFLAGEYAELIERHMAAEQHDFHRLQLVLTSLVRVGYHDFARHMGDRLLPDWPGGDWERDLLRLSIADFLDPAELLRRALTPEQTCQAHYYVGEFAITAGNAPLAQQAFRLASETLAGCLESRLARRRLIASGEDREALERTEVRERVVRATHEGKRLADRGEHERSLVLLGETLAQARARLDPDEVEVGSLHRQLGETWLSWERWAEARQEFESALPILRPHIASRPDKLLSLLNNLGVACMKLGDFATARPLYREVVAQREGSLGLDHADTVLALDNLAHLEQVAGDLLEARRLAQEVLRRRRRSLGDQHPRTLDSFDNLAEVLELQGDTGSAEKLRAEAARLESRAGETPSPAEADERSADLAELGKRCLDRGDYRDAQSWYEQALAVRRSAQPEDDTATASLISNLAYSLWSQGENDLAEPLNREALAIRRRLLPPDHPDIAFSCNNLAQTIQTKGRLAEAEALMHEALAIDRAAFRDEGDAVAGDLHNLALLYTKTGRPAEAKRFYRQALDLWKLRYPGGHRHVLAALHNLTNLLLHQCDQGELGPLIEEEVALAEKLFGDDHPELCPHLGQLATLLRLRHRFDEAGQILERSLAIGRKRLPPHHRSLANVQNDLGILRNHQGDHGAAVTAFLEGWERLADDPGAEGTADTIASNLAWSFGCLGRFAESAEWSRRALSPRGEASYPLSRARSWGHLGLAEAASGRPQKALKAMLESARLFDEAFDQTLDGSTDRQRDDLLDMGRQQWDEILSLLGSALLDDAQAVRAVADFVLRRKGIATALLELQTAAVHEAENPEVRGLADELRSLRARIASETLLGMGPAAWSAPVDLREAKGRARLLEERLVALLPLAKRRAETSASCAKVLAALPEGAALIEFVHFKEFDFRNWHRSRSPVEQLFGRHRYLALVLRAGSAEVRAIDLASDRTIDELVGRWREEITGEVPFDRGLVPIGVSITEPEPTPADAGKALRAAALDPVLAALQGCRQLILAPDGMLALIPFGALPLPDGRLLMDEYRLSHVLVGRDVLKAGRSAPTAPGEAVVIADPDFELRDPERELPELVQIVLETTPSARISPLPGTRAEAIAIAPMLGVQPWLGAEALKSRLLAVRSPRVLHLATHGYLSAGAGIDARLYAATSRAPEDANPLLASGLLLAGAGWKAGRFAPPEGAGDGVLTALEAAALDLRGTRLVVLSACETGLGVQRRGDGLLGLRRSFLVAGARALVSSLWKVPDEATAELMQAFYEHLSEGRPCGEALAEAQRVLRLRYPRQPVAWAGFVCYGDPGCVVR